MLAQSFAGGPINVGPLVKTAQMEQDGTRHGTASGYSYHGCRCAECKAHKSASDRARYERTRGDRPRKAKNPDTITPSERTRLWRLANPGAKKAHDATYIAKNREELNRKSREWHRDNYEKSRATQRAYWQTEAGKANRRVANFKRRAGRLRNLDAETREYLQVIATDPCSYCGGVADTVDHIVPLSRGGENHWTNMTAACLSCNSRKHNKSLLVFLLELNAPSSTTPVLETSKIEVAPNGSTRVQPDSTPPLPGRHDHRYVVRSNNRAHRRRLTPVHRRRNDCRHDGWCRRVHLQVRCGRWRRGQRRCQNCARCYHHCPLIQCERER